MINFWKSWKIENINWRDCFGNWKFAAMESSPGFSVLDTPTTYNVIDEQKIDWRRKDFNISVNISFVPYFRPTSDRRPIYYVALYGDAQPYGSSQEVGFIEMLSDIPSSFSFICYFYFIVFPAMDESNGLHAYRQWGSSSKISALRLRIPLYSLVFGGVAIKSY